MGELAATDALKDAGIPYDKVEAVVASYCYGDPTCGMIIRVLFLFDCWPGNHNVN